MICCRLVEDPSAVPEAVVEIHGGVDRDRGWLFCLEHGFQDSDAVDFREMGDEGASRQVV